VFCLGRLREGVRGGEGEYFRVRETPSTSLRSSLPLKTGGETFRGSISVSTESLEEDSVASKPYSSRESATIPKVLLITADLFCDYYIMVGLLIY
jgi:hypothetical protein